MKKINVLCYYLFASIGVAFLSSPATAQSVKKYTQNVEPQGATSVQMQFTQSAGTLKMSGGATTHLMEGVFTMTNQAWKPEISFTNQNNKGTLIVKQPGGKNVNMDDGDSNDWQVRLNNSIPMDMELTVGAGQSTVDLRNTKLSKLHLKAGAGDFTVNLANTSVPTLDIDAGVGEMKLDLSGKWSNNLEAEINGGIGEITLKLPRKTGVRVKVNGLGSIGHEGFKKEEGYYVNESYKKTSSTLQIEINCGLGSVNLELEK
ncbi:DUF4097 family beta strand repeat protein [Rhodocytophaga rosea]|uniref:DUF4097 family beta strand repeat protein n=1 Tax=Rhodocytophaga rosea TaxID=2704465 RepID=A0A6C0GVS9_9BACT|nr:toast rack family protein [Rhodocytophaga rosea]QHT71390.1 DUF4097 family beta strand repeat protein [Rhodocytophaga rosea]